MVKFSKRTDAISNIKMNFSTDAVLFLIQEQLDNAEKELLSTSPNHTDLRDRLVKAQSYRLLLTVLTQDLK